MIKEVKHEDGDTPIRYDVYRKEECPYGKKAVSLLNQKGVTYVDHIFENPKEEEDLKTQHNVKTTPQIFVEGSRIGGYTELSESMGRSPEQESTTETSYTPIIAVASVSIILAMTTAQSIMSFMGFFLAILACLKLMDLSSFKANFKNYDLVTQKWPRYAELFPYIELGIAAAVLSGLLSTFSGVISIAVGIIGTISIIDAVYIKKKDLSCACIGGNNRLPLGAVSVSENLAMVVMGIYLISI